MKKLLNWNLWLLLAAICSCALTFSACGDDDEDEETGGPYTGVWNMTHITITEDGETESGAVTGATIRLTLNNDYTYSYYAYTPAEDGYPAETIDESGTWSYADGVLTLVMNAGDYTETSFLTVTKWTNNQLITLQAEDGYSEQRTWGR